MTSTISFVRNPYRSTVDRAATADAGPLSLLHRRMPGYAPTPLHEAPGLAEAWQVSRVLIKHEASRFGLPAFKVLGASWAVFRALSEELDVPLGTALDDAVRQRLTQTNLRRLVTATDGNHGRAVAWTARFFGLSAQVFVPAQTAMAPVEAIRSESADVVVVAGDYDDACAAAAMSVVGCSDRLLVQDTYAPGHEQVPSWIAEGYRSMLHEADEQGALEAAVVFVPTGVGALASAVAGHYADRSARIVTVEPLDAACLLASIEGGQMTPAPGPHRTAMAGLNCATPSAVAWPSLRARLDGCVAVTDEAAAAAMCQLGDCGIRAGATGAAAAAGAALVCSSLQAREEMEVSADSTLLLLVTEGVTDPVHYAQVLAARV